MKKVCFLLFTAALFSVPGGIAWAGPANGSPATLSFRSSVSLSDHAGHPAVNDSVKNITLAFSAPLDPKTVPGGVKLSRLTPGGEQEEPFVAAVDKKTPTLLLVSRKDGTRFAEGEAYKITISDKVRSKGKNSLAKEFTGYFAVDHSFALGENGLAGLNSERSLIVCISDLHLGMDDRYAECVENREPLLNFLGKIRLAPNVKELVIAGDLVDEWFIPAGIDTYSGGTQRDFVEKLAANNQSVMGAFNNIIRDGKIKVTYVPGNHDLRITAEDIQSILPGISQARDVKGLGAYSPEGHPEMIIEHGHRYNYFCAPDPISNRSIAPGSILPPGYFFTRIATASVVQGHPTAGGTMRAVTANNLGESQKNMFIYWNVWKEMMLELPVKEGFDDKIIVTNIDGFTEKYSINDLMPYQVLPGGLIEVNLFRGMQETWDERQALNKVAVKVPLEEAIARAADAREMDHQAVVQYFTNPASDKRIVIMGHTHDARIVPSENHAGQKTIYANSGTWIDKNGSLPTTTFVVVAPQKGKDSAPTYVGLYHYSQSGDITKIDAQAITNLK